MISVDYGPTSSKVEVVTETSGDADVYTRVEQTVNGQTQVFESSEAGEYKLEMTSPVEEKFEDVVDVENQEPLKQDKKINTLFNQIEKIWQKLRSLLSSLF